jgi:hypothetical protein
MDQGGLIYFQSLDGLGFLKRYSNHPLPHPSAMCAAMFFLSFPLIFMAVVHHHQRPYSSPLLRMSRTGEKVPNRIHFAPLSCFVLAALIAPCCSLTR